MTESPREQKRNSEDIFQLSPDLSSIFSGSYLKNLLPRYNNIVQLLISRVHKPEANIWAFWPVVCQYITEGSLSEKQLFSNQYFGALQGSTYLLPLNSLSLKNLPQSRIVIPFSKSVRVGGKGKSFLTSKTYPAEEMSMTAFHFYQNNS